MKRDLRHSEKLCANVSRFRYAKLKGSSHSFEIREAYRKSQSSYYFTALST